MSTLAVVVLPLVMGSPGFDAREQAGAPSAARISTPTALINGQWFNGTRFEPRTVYSVDGRFTSARPNSVERTIDLAGAWIVPPFGEAHNHNVDGAVEARARQALARYLVDGVFYVKIQGNYPITDDLRQRLPMNRPDGPDVVLAQPFLTATGGHPIQLHEDVLLAQGYYPGVSREQLRNRLYFTIDSEADLDDKWPQIVALRPDFIKTNLWSSEEFEKRRNDSRFFGMRGLNPALLPTIVARARQHRLRVSAHISNAFDFHNAVASGVDEIVHSGSPSPLNTIENSNITPELMKNPAELFALFLRTLSGTGGAVSTYRPVAVEDAKLAAQRGIVVITTIGGVTRTPETMRGAVRPPTAANLKLLRDNGVRLAIGSDNVGDTSVVEFEQLATLGVFDNMSMLKMWSETTPQAIFPHRRIGFLRDGYEASFLALGGNPLEDLRNVREIRFRFKQGVLLQMQPRSKE